jgi:hypothetical protein
MATNWVIQNPQLGAPPIEQTRASSLTAGRSVPYKLGDIVKAVHPTYGSGEFIYLLGVASTVVGSVVTWGGNSSGTPTFQTALAPATANLAQPLAVAMSANVAGQYGWYQIEGQAVAATNGTLAAGPGPVYLAGSGQLTSTAAAGKQVLGAINVTATGTPAAGQAVVEINRPAAQGAIT